MLLSPKWQTMWMDSQYCSKSIVQLALPTQQAKKILEDLKTNCSSPIKAIQLEALKCWGIWIRNQKEDEWKQNAVCYAAARPLLVKKLQPLLKDVDVCKAKLSLMWELIHKVQNLMQLEGPQFILEVFLQSCLTWLSIDGIDDQISGLVFQLLLALFGKDYELIDCDKDMFPALTADVLGFRKVFCSLADKLLNIIVIWKKVKDKSTILKIWKCFLEKCENSWENIPVPIWHKIFKILTQIYSEESETIEERLRFLHGCALIPKSVLCSSKFIDHGNLLTTPCEALLKDFIQLCTVEGSNDQNVQLFALSKEICEVLTEKSISFGNYDLCLLIVDFLEEFALKSLVWGVWCGLVRCFQSNLKHIHRSHYTKIQMKFYRKLRGVVANFDLDKEFLHEDCIFEVKKCMEVLDVQWLCTSCGAEAFNSCETETEPTELNVEIGKTKELSLMSLASQEFSRMLSSPRPPKPFSKLVDVNLDFVENILKTVNRQQLKPFVKNYTVRLGLNSTNGITSTLSSRRKKIATLPAICEAVEEEEQISYTEKSNKVSVVKPNVPSLETIQEIKVEENLNSNGEAVVEKDLVNELQGVEEKEKEIWGNELEEEMKEKERSEELNSSLEENTLTKPEGKQNEEEIFEVKLSTVKENSLEAELNEEVGKKVDLSEKEEVFGQENVETKSNFGEKTRKRQKSESLEVEQIITETPRKRNFRSSQKQEEIKIENAEEKVKQELKNNEKLKSIDDGEKTTDGRKMKKKSSNETGIEIKNKKTKQESKAKDSPFKEKEVPVNREVERINKSKGCPQEPEVKPKGVRPEEDEDIKSEKQLASSKKLTISEKEKLKVESNRSEKALQSEVKKVTQSTPKKTTRELSKLDVTIQDDTPSTPKTRSKRKAEEELKRKERKRKNKTFEAVVQEIVRKNKLRKSEKNTKSSPGSGSKKTGEGPKRHLRNSTGKLENYFKVIAKKTGSGEVALTDEKKSPNGWKQTSLRTMMKKREKLRGRNEREKVWKPEKTKISDDKNLANVSPYKEVFHDHEYVKAAHMNRSGTLSEPKIYDSLPLEKEVTLPIAKPTAGKHLRKLKEEQPDVNEEPKNQMIVPEDKITEETKVLSIQTKPKIKVEDSKQNKTVVVEKSKTVEPANPEIRMQESNVEGSKCYEETKSSVCSEKIRTTPKHKPNILRRRVTRNLKEEEKTDVGDSSKPLKDGINDGIKMEEKDVEKNQSEIKPKVDEGKAAESETPKTRHSRKSKEEKPESVNCIRETRNSKNRQAESEKVDEKKEKVQHNLSPTATLIKNPREKVEEEKVTASKEVKSTGVKVVREGKRGRKEKEHPRVTEEVKPKVELKMEPKVEPMGVNFCEKKDPERTAMKIEHFDKKPEKMSGQNLRDTNEIEEPEKVESETRKLRSVCPQENFNLEIEKSVKPKIITPLETRFARKMKEAEKHSPEINLEAKNVSEVNLAPKAKSTSPPETRFSKKLREVESREEASSEVKEENNVEGLEARDCQKDKEAEWTRTDAAASSKEALGSGTIRTPVIRFLRSKDVLKGVNFSNPEVADSMKKSETKKGEAELVEAKEPVMDVGSFASKTKKKFSQKIDEKQSPEPNALKSKVETCAGESNMADAGKAQICGTKAENVKTPEVVLPSAKESKLETKNSHSMPEASKLEPFQTIKPLDKQSRDTERLTSNEPQTPDTNCTILKESPRFNEKVETELLECKKLETPSDETKMKGKPAQDVTALTKTKKTFDEVLVKSQGSTKKNTLLLKAEEESRSKRTQNEEGSKQLTKTEPSKPNKAGTPERICETSGLSSPEEKTTEAKTIAKEKLDFRGEVSEVKAQNDVENLEKTKENPIGEENRTGSLTNGTESEIFKTRFSRRLEALIQKQKTRESQMTDGKDPTSSLQEILTECREAKPEIKSYVNGKGILESEGAVLSETEMQRAKENETPKSNSEAVAKTNELSTLEEKKCSKRIEIEDAKAPSGATEKSQKPDDSRTESLLEESCRAKIARVLEDEISPKTQTEVLEVTEKAKQVKNRTEVVKEDGDESDKLEKEFPAELEVNSATTTVPLVTRFSQKLKEIGRSIVMSTWKDSAVIENLETSGNEELFVGRQELAQENYKTEEECPRRGKKRTRIMDSLKPSKKIKLDEEFLEENKDLLEVVEKENLEELEEVAKNKDETPVRTSNGTLSSRALRMIALVPESTKPGLAHREATPRPDASKGLKKGPNVDKNSRASKMLALLSENVLLEEDEWAEELTKESNGSAAVATTPTSTLRSPNSSKKRKLIRFDDAKNETILYLTDTPPSQIKMLRKSNVQEVASA